MSTVLLEYGRMPRSALRHRPIAPALQERELLQARATKEIHATKAKRAPHTTGGPPSANIVSKRSRHPLALVVLSMLLTFLFLWGIQGVWSWGSSQIDTLRYGYPRTIHIDRAVGHEVGKTLSHFEGFNIKGQIYVLEIPGGNASNSHLFLGPHLQGPGADLEPVTLTFLGNSQHPDLLLEVHGIETRFHNTGKNYIPG